MLILVYCKQVSNLSPQDQGNMGCALKQSTRDWMRDERMTADKGWRYIVSTMKWRHRGTNICGNCRWKSHMKLCLVLVSQTCFMSRYWQVPNPRWLGRKGTDVMLSPPTWLCVKMGSHVTPFYCFVNFGEQSHYNEVCPSTTTVMNYSCHSFLT